MRTGHLRSSNRIIVIFDVHENFGGYIYFILSFAWFFNLSRTIGSLQPVQILPETPQTLLKYERMPGQVKMFLACMSNNFS
ncbi:unnamed protein product [Rhizophagus irregularis]|nr:unnamed protein product [Rhizophagus irregularis]